MATHSSVLAWRIPGTGEPGELPSTGSQRVGHDWSDLAVTAATLLKREEELEVESVAKDHLISYAYITKPPWNPKGLDSKNFWVGEHEEIWGEWSASGGHRHSASLLPTYLPYASLPPGCVCVLSQFWLFATPWTVAHQASLTMEFSKQEYWRGLAFSTPGNLPNPGIAPMSIVSSALADGFITTAPLENPWWLLSIIFL